MHVFTLQGEPRTVIRMPKCAGLSRRSKEAGTLWGIVCAGERVFVTDYDRNALYALRRGAINPAAEEALAAWKATKEAAEQEAQAEAAAQAELNASAARRLGAAILEFRESLPEAQAAGGLETVVKLKGVRRAAFDALIEAGCGPSVAVSIGQRVQLERRDFVRLFGEANVTWRPGLSTPRYSCSGLVVSWKPTPNPQLTFDQAMTYGLHAEDIGQLKAKIKCKPVKIQ